MISRKKRLDIDMSITLARPHIHEGRAARDQCEHCDARPSSVCNAIPEADLSRLAAAAMVMEIPAGTTFIQEGEPATAFFNITRGTAKLFKLLPDGRRQITGFARVGHFLGLAVSDTFAFSAEAIEPVRLCRFSRIRLRVLLDDFPAMEKRLLEVAANELVAAQEQMLLLGRKTARERLASFLVMQSHQAAPCQPARTRFALPMTRGDIADYLGLTIETISRTLTHFRTEGLIDIPAQSELFIRAPKALASLADGLG
ncbi:MAG TPA: helix-turn-helix domain-containing protein [Acetobacteraceae bacterium]|jgi:CRP/FNR family transcriptional regulator